MGPPTKSVEFFATQFDRQIVAAEYALNPFERLALPWLSGSLLDLGCGLGNLSLAAARSGCRVTAIDACANAVADLGARASRDALPVEAFEALLVAADAYKRTRSTDPKALADAIRTTNITDNVSIGPGIQFDAKGQNDKLKNAAIQNRGGKLVTVAPKEASNAAPELPMPPYDRR